jgi:hypothetical protein
MSSEEKFMLPASSASSVSSPTSVSLNVKSVPQYGYTCKTVAIAAVEAYFAEKYGYSALPLEKTIKGYEAKAPESTDDAVVFEREIVSRKPSKVRVSIRELAKHRGSVQGELLELSQVPDILKEMGYEKSTTVDFRYNFDLFKSTIKEKLRKGNLVIAFFAVDQNLESPSLGFPVGVEGKSAEDLAHLGSSGEHAAVISGFDEEKDELQMVHWGKSWTTSFQSFYDAAMILEEQHGKNTYRKNLSWVGDSTAWKYDAGSMDIDSSIRIRESITPRPGSGFKGQLVVIEAPEPSKILEMRVLRSPAGQVGGYVEAHEALLLKLSSPDSAVPENLKQIIRALRRSVNFWGASSSGLSFNQRSQVTRLFRDINLLIDDPSYENFKRVVLNSYSKGIQAVIADPSDQFTKSCIKKLTEVLKLFMPTDGPEKEKYSALFSDLFGDYLPNLSRVEISSLQKLFQEYPDLVMDCPKRALEKVRFIERNLRDGMLDVISEIYERGISTLPEEKQEVCYQRITRRYFGSMEFLVATKALSDALEEILKLPAGEGRNSAMEAAVDRWLAVPVLAASVAARPFFDSSISATPVTALPTPSIPLIFSRRV